MFRSKNEEASGPGGPTDIDAKCQEYFEGQAITLAALESTVRQIEKNVEEVEVSSEEEIQTKTLSEESASKYFIIFTGHLTPGVDVRDFILVERPCVAVVHAVCRICWRRGEASVEEEFVELPCQSSEARSVASEDEAPSSEEGPGSIEG